MHLDQLRYLAEIKQCASINAASQKLHMTSSALCTAIKKLEDELGFQVLYRTHRGTTLTSGGQRLVQLADYFLAEVVALQQLETARHQDIQGEINFLSSFSVFNSFLTHFLYEFHQNYPQVEVITREVTFNQIIKSIQEQTSEFALIYCPYFSEAEAPYFQFPSDLHFQPFFKSKIYFRTQISYPLAKYKSISLKSALAYPIILCHSLYEVRENNVQYQLLQAYGNPEHILFESNPYILEEYVRNGTAASLCVDFFFCESSDIVKVAIKEDIYTQFGFLHQQPLSPLAQLFLDSLSTALYNNNL